MKKQVVLAFVCGLLLPLVMAAVGGQAVETPQPVESESEGLSPHTETALWDDQVRIMVLTESGNVRQMRLGEYLTGVVLAEMPVAFEPEALKAQAVVARTYTCKRMEHNKHGAAAVCMDSGCCQGYRDEEDYVNSGGARENVEKIRSAVTSTDGQVIYYGGELIDATYFSCSGGYTEDAVAVWGQDVPYLQAVESPGEEAAPKYESTVCYTPENFCLVTGVSGQGSPGTWFGRVTYTDGGGVDTMVICGKNYSGTALRKALGLRSTLFRIYVSEGMIVIETKGFGHRVGMSQYGAQAMALGGSDYEQILKHYYTGTVLRQQTA